MLQEHQPLSLITLGSLLICESGSPSRLVNGLVERSLVERTPSATNGRMVTLTLTEKGEAMAIRVSAVEAVLYEFLINAFEGVSLSAITTFLGRIVEGRPAGEALARRIGNAYETVDA